MSWDDPALDRYRAGGGSALDSYLEDLSTRVGLDPFYVNLLKQRETGGLSNPYSAESSAGALGALQVMPETGAEMAEKYGLDFGTTEGQMEAGARYFKEQLDRFEDPSIAAAAYHSGPGRVQGILDRGGDLGTDLGPVGRDYYSWFREQVEGREDQVKAKPPPPPDISLVGSAPQPTRIEAPPAVARPQLPPPPGRAPTTAELRAPAPDDEELIRNMPMWQRALLGFAEGAEKVGQLPGLHQAHQLVGLPKQAMEEGVYSKLGGYDPATQTLGGVAADPVGKGVFEATKGLPPWAQALATGGSMAATSTLVDIASDPVVWGMTFARQPVRALGRLSPALARGAIIGLKGMHRLFQLGMAEHAAVDIPRGIVGAVNEPEEPQGWYQIGSGTISGYMVAHPFLRKVGQPKPYQGPVKLSVPDKATGEWVDLRKVNPEIAGYLDRAPGMGKVRTWENDNVAGIWDLLVEKGVKVEDPNTGQSYILRPDSVEIPEQHVVFGTGARGLSNAERGGRLGIDIGHLLVDIWAHEKPADRPRALAEMIHELSVHEVTHLIMEGGVPHELPAEVRQKLSTLSQKYGLARRGILSPSLGERRVDWSQYYAERRAILQEAGIDPGYKGETYAQLYRAVEGAIGHGDIAAILAKMTGHKDPQGFIEAYKRNPEEAVKSLDLSEFQKTVENLEREIGEMRRLFPEAYLTEVEQGTRLTTPEIMAETGGIPAPPAPGPRAEALGAPPLPAGYERPQIPGTARPPRLRRDMPAEGRGKGRKKLEEEDLWEDLSGARMPGEEGLPRPEPLDAAAKREEAQRGPRGETTKGAPPRVQHPEERGLRFALQFKERQIRESQRAIEEARKKADQIRAELGEGTVEREIREIVDQIQMRKLEEFQQRKKKKDMEAGGRRPPEEPIWQRRRREAQERRAGMSQRTAFMMGPPQRGMSAYERDLVQDIIPRLERLRDIARTRNPLELELAEYTLKEARKELAALRGAKLPLAHVAEHFYAAGRPPKKEGPQLRTAGEAYFKAAKYRQKEGISARAERRRAIRQAPLRTETDMRPRLRTQEGLVPSPTVEGPKRKIRKPPARQSTRANQDRMMLEATKAAIEAKRRRGEDVSDLEAWVKRQEAKIGDMKAEGRLISPEEFGLKKGQEPTPEQWDRIKIKAKWRIAKAAREYAEELIDRGLTPREAWDYAEQLTQPTINFIDRLPELVRELNQMKAEGRKPPEILKAPKDRIETPDELMARAEKNLKIKLEQRKWKAVQREMRRQAEREAQRLREEREFIKEQFRREVREQFKPPPKRKTVTPEESTEILGDTIAEKDLFPSPKEKALARKGVREAVKAKKKEELPPPVRKKDFQPGMRVEHPEFGPGTIEKRRANGNVVVRFEDPSVGEKLMSPDVLRLRKKPPTMKAEGRGKKKKVIKDIQKKLETEYDWTHQVALLEGIYTSIEKNKALLAKETSPKGRERLQNLIDMAQNAFNQYPKESKSEAIGNVRARAGKPKYYMAEGRKSKQAEKEKHVWDDELKEWRRVFEAPPTVTPERRRLNMQAFMDESKVKVPLYHGTKFDREAIRAFEKSKQDPNALYGPGVYMSDSPHLASTYAKKQRPLTAEDLRIAHDTLLDTLYGTGKRKLDPLGRYFRQETRRSFEVIPKYVADFYAKYVIPKLGTGMYNEGLTWRTHKPFLTATGKKIPTAIRPGLEPAPDHVVDIEVLRAQRDRGLTKEQGIEINKHSGNIDWAWREIIREQTKGAGQVLKLVAQVRNPFVIDRMVETKESASRRKYDPEYKPRHDIVDEMYTREQATEIMGKIRDALRLEHRLGKDYMESMDASEALSIKRREKDISVAYEDYTKSLPETLTGDKLYKNYLLGMVERANVEVSGGNSLAALNRALADVGYDAITHTGGRMTGGTKHRVVISLDPSKIKSFYSGTDFTTAVNDLMRAEGRGDMAAAGEVAKAFGERSVIKGIKAASPERLREMAIEYRPEMIRSIRRQLRKVLKDTEFENVGLEGLKQRRAELSPEARELLDRGMELGIRGEEFDKLSGIQRYDPLFEKLGAPRAIITSLDLSGILRQGIVGTARLGFTNPITLVRAINRSIGALASEKVFKRSMEAVENSPDYALLKALGVDFARTEEQFGGAKYVEGVFKKLTGGRGNFVRMSERAYTYYLNRLRYELGKKHLDSLRRIGFELKSHTDKKGRMSISGDVEVYKRMGDWINIATGRGSLPKGQDKLSAAVRSADKFLNAVFFSPRLMLARVALLNPMTYLGAAAEMRRAGGTFKATRALMAVHGLDFIAYAGLVSTVMGGLKMMFPDAEIEDDLTSSDFGQVRIGRTRVDVTGGTRTYLTAAARMIAGETKTEYGTIKPQTGWRTLANFFRGKLGPMPSLAVTLAEGRNVIGEPAYGPLKDVLKGDEPITPEVLQEILRVTGGTIAESTVIPMIASDVFNLIRDNEFTPVQIAALLSLATLGTGVTTREPPPGLTPLTQQALRTAQVEPLSRPYRIQTPFRDALGQRMELKLPYMIQKHLQEHSDKEFYEMLDVVVRTPGFQALPPAAQRIAIASLLTDARQARSPRAMLNWGAARIFPKVREERYPEELRRLKPPPPGIPPKRRWTDLGDLIGMATD